MSDSFAFQMIEIDLQSQQLSDATLTW